MRFLSLFLVVWLVLQSSVITLAAEPKAVPLMKGEPAPFSGVLVPEKRLTGLLGAEIERDELKVKLKVSLDLCGIEREEYRKALKRKWYQEPRFNQVAGFVLGVLATGISIYGATSIINH